ncbi:hypothetical protein ACHAXA_011149 [Cyclostephanos tholiformis]|uniref:Plastid lipid-associated protein/fibrillin conserved domain-containing protein n=1 Tax=Cyclostephanos tholiformis TaxID=382380 RepID=A0ABD3SEY1_9STRA
MSSNKGAATSTMLVVIILAVFPPSTHAFHPPTVLHRHFRDRPVPYGIVPLFATEEFQRSLLESQFANSAPDIAPRIDVVTAASASSSSSSSSSSVAVSPPPNDDDDGTARAMTSSIQNSLLRIAASTDRGQNANAVQGERARALISALESNDDAIPDEDDDDDDDDDVILPSYLTGTWDLLYSNTQLFRSSPFFLAGRSTCKTPERARQYDWFCDMHRRALSISNIGNVRQVISRDGKMTNEFEVRVGSVPFLSDVMPNFGGYSGGLPFTIDGAIVSTADVTPIGRSSYSNSSSSVDWEVYMDTVEIRGSNVPILRNLLDSRIVALRSRDLSRVLEENVDGYEIPRPVLRTTYVDDYIRIVRDMDDNVFVYGRASKCEDPTDYSGVLPDLGVASLLEGFNDAVAKIYL